MSIDKLQSQIRKLKNPSVICFVLDQTQIPVQYLRAYPSAPQAYCVYGKALLTALKGIVPAVRFGFGSFALNGQAGLACLQELLTFANENGFYIILDGPELLSGREAMLAADTFFDQACLWKFDALLISGYIGSDAVKPFAAKLKTTDKALFAAVRTGNKSAPELQDLLTGSRLVYTAAADMVRRMGENLICKCGYSKIGAVGAATSTDSLRTLRGKYPTVFLLIDGYDYSGANAKNCSAGFDKLGHGAVVCAGTSVISAWQEDNAEAEPVEAAVQAAERMRKNLTRYVTVL